MALIPNLRLSDLDLFERVGCGTFGEVFMGRYRPTRQVIAVKRLSKARTIQLRQVEHLKNEREALTISRHPLLVQFLGSFADANYIYLISEYIPGGELFKYLVERDCLHVEEARFYAAEVALALGYLHSKGIIYRDLKPENILLAANGHIKITDFGFAKTLGPENPQTYTRCISANTLVLALEKDKSDKMIWIEARNLEEGMIISSPIESQSSNLEFIENSEQIEHISKGKEILYNITIDGEVVLKCTHDHLLILTFKDSERIISDCIKPIGKHLFGVEVEEFMKLPEEVKSLARIILLDEGEKNPIGVPFNISKCVEEGETEFITVSLLGKNRLMVVKNNRDSKHVLLTHNCGTPEYMAPEVIKCSGHDASSDWWSLGILLYEMLCGGPPFTTEDGPAEDVYNIILNSTEVVPETPMADKPKGSYNYAIEFPRHVNNTTRDIICRLLAPDRRLRLGASIEDYRAVLSHPFFESVIWNEDTVVQTPPIIPNVASPDDVTNYINDEESSEDFQSQSSEGYYSYGESRSASNSMSEDPFADW